MTSAELLVTDLLYRQATVYVVVVATGASVFVLWFGIAGVRRLADQSSRDS